MDETRMSQVMFGIWTVFLLAVCFIFDLLTPGPTGNLLYLSLILFAGWFAMRRAQIVGIAVAVSLFMGLAFWVTVPSAERVPASSGYLLALAGFWFFTLFILAYRRELEIRDSVAAVLTCGSLAFIRCSLNGRVLIWNRGAEVLYGYRAGEMIDQSLQVLFPSQGADDFSRLMDRVSARPVREVLEMPQLDRHGQTRTMELILSVQTDFKGRPAGFSLLVRDISVELGRRVEFKKIKEALLGDRARLALFLKLLTGLDHSRRAEVLVKEVVDQTSQVLRAQKCSFMFVDQETGHMLVKAYKGLDARIVQGTQLLIGNPVAAEVIRGGLPILVKDIETDARFKRENRPTYQSKSFMSVPLRIQDHIAGVLSVADKIAAEAFDELDLQMLTLIGQRVAQAIEDAQLYGDLQQIQVAEGPLNLERYRQFIHGVDAEIQRVRRYQEPCCLLLLAVDDFAEYVNQLGETQGRVLTEEIYQYLIRHLREVDKVYHYSTHEFALVFPRTEMEGAKTVALRIQRQLEGISPQRVVTLSMGVVQCHPDMTRDDLIAKACQGCGPGP